MTQVAGNPGSVFTDTFLNEKRLHTDPEADKLIEELVRENGKAEAKQLFDTLISHIELPLEKMPNSIQGFVEAQRKLPSWADTEKIGKAQALFIDHGPKFLIFLYYKSLPILYSCANGAEVLVQTGRLAHQEDGFEQFSRRIAETGQFLMDVMAPGGFSGNLPAVEAIIKVRLIHAAVREFIPKAHWDESRLGKPVNQEDLVLTLMTFSISILDALERTGVDESDDRIEAYLHCWKVIGHYLGIDHDLFPRSPADARILIARILERQSRKSQAGVLLTKALLDFSSKNLPEGVLKDAPEVLMRFFTGDRIADILEVHAPYGCLLSWMPGFLKSVFRVGEKLEERSPLLKNIIDEFSIKSTRKMVDFFNKSKQTHFRIPDALKMKWLE